ncbi:MAG: hypothetical protein R3E89_17365 [Thiolinea sp.]
MSYARLILFTLDPGSRTFGEGIADQFAPALRSMPGFEQVSFFLDETSGEYGSLTVWASKDEADAANQLTMPRLQQALEGKLKAPPVIKEFEVYLPKN